MLHATPTRRVWWGALWLAFAGCINLNYNGKDQCTKQADCLDGNICVIGFCIPQDQIDAARGGDGDEQGDAGHPDSGDSSLSGDQDGGLNAAPTPPTLDPAGGTFNLENAPSCVDVEHVRQGFAVRFTLTQDGSDPPEPDTNSPAADAQGKICGLASDGFTRIRVSQFGPQGPSPSALYEYQSDSTPPSAPVLPPSGVINLKTFSCPLLTGLEADAQVFYNIRTDGLDPGIPNEQSSAVDLVVEQPMVCGIPSNGVAYINVRQRDQAGNFSDTASYQYTVDTSAPFNPGIEPALASYGIANKPECFTLFTSYPYGEPNLTYFYEYTTDGSEPKTPDPATSPSVPADANARASVCGLIEENAATIVKATTMDAAGNMPNGYPERGSSRTFIVDTVRPKVLSLKHFSEGKVYAGQRIVFELMPDEQNGTAVVQIGRTEVKLDQRRADGSLRGSYLVKKDDNLVDASVTGWFTDFAGNSSAPFISAQTVTCDGIGLNHSGELIRANSVWKAADSPHFLSANALVMEGATLTVEPGAYILFGADAEVGSAVTLEALDSRITMVGTAENPIVIAGGGSLLLRSEAGGASFDEQGQYVRGPHFEHVSAKRTSVSFTSSTWGYASAYLKHCELGTLVNSYNALDGAYVGYSTITAFNPDYAVQISRSLIEENLISSFAMVSNGTTVRHNEINKLLLSLGTSSSTTDRLEFNVIATLQLSPPWYPTVSKNHLASVVLLNRDSATAKVNGNYWGTKGTQELQQKGADANISFIRDVRDDLNLGLVDYSDWLSEPIPGVGAQWN